MGEWLHEEGDRVAHYYPDDDEVTRAACGNVLAEECHACGHTLQCNPVSRRETTLPKCGTCLRAAESECPAVEKP